MALVCDSKSDNIAETEAMEAKEEVEQENPPPASTEDLEDGEIEDGEIEDDDEEDSTPQAQIAPVQNQDASGQQTPASLNKTLSPGSDKSTRTVDSFKERPGRRDSREKDKDKDKRKHKEEKGGKHMTEAEKSILHLRKRERMQREKWEKMRRDVLEPPVEDDFAVNLEKTLASILKKDKTSSGDDEMREEDKRGKKRKKKDKEPLRGGKQSRLDSPLRPDDQDNVEMINPWLSPVNPHRGLNLDRTDRRNTRSRSRDSEESYISDKSVERGRNNKKNKKKNKNKNKNSKNSRNNQGGNNKNSREPKMALKDDQGVCVFYLQGKCQKKDCPYSHEAVPPMKLELCKFYLMDCCAKGEHCSYMHSDFPCKFYHTGLTCAEGDNCKFAHGKPLSDNLRQILFKHIDSAPRDLLCGFPRMNREEALNKINTTQDHLRQIYSESKDGYTSFEDKKDDNGLIPSLFDMNVPLPPELSEPSTNKEFFEKKTEKSDRKRKSRWQDPEPLEMSSESTNNPSNFSIQQPFSFATKDQDMRITSNGDIDMRTLTHSLGQPPLIINPTLPTALTTTIISTLDSLNSLHPLDTPLGSLNQTTPTMSITNSNTIENINISDNTTAIVPNITDTDIRSNISLPIGFTSINSGEPHMVVPSSDGTATTNSHIDIRNQAMPVLSTIPSMTSVLGGSVDLDHRILSTKDVDIRVLPQLGDVSNLSGDNALSDGSSGGDNDQQSINIPSTLPKTQQELYLRIQSQQKDSTQDTQNSDSNEFVPDINWYSDDDDDDENRLMIKDDNDDVKEKEEMETDTRKEEESDEKSNSSDEQSQQSTTSKHSEKSKASELVEKLGDLSKINITMEVSKLLSSISQSAHNIKPETTIRDPRQSSQTLESLGSPRGIKSDPRHRDSQVGGTMSQVGGSTDIASLIADPRKKGDPRLAKEDPRTKRKDSVDSVKSTDKYSDKLSIYEQGSFDVEDLDLRISSSDDYKSSRSDVDLRNLALPFKGIQNYTPATEIDASINSHLPILWTVHIVEIPRPDYSNLKLTLSDAEKTGDPRLKKIFRLSTEEKDSPASPKASPRAAASTSSTTVRIDPRLKKVEEHKTDGVMNYNQQLQMLQASVFYQSLTSNQKLLLNQELASRCDQTNTHDPMLNTLLSNLNLVPPPGVTQGHNPATMGVALNILSNINKMNAGMLQNVANIPGINPAILNPATSGLLGLGQPGLLGAAPGIPNMPQDFQMSNMSNFNDPRAMGNPAAFSFVGNASNDFQGNYDDNDYYQDNSGGFNNSGGGHHNNNRRNDRSNNFNNNRDNRRRPNRNFGGNNSNRNNNNRNFGRHNNRNDRNRSRHSPP